MSMPLKLAAVCAAILAIILYATGVAYLAGYEAHAFANSDRVSLGHAIESIRSAGTGSVLEKALLIALFPSCVFVVLLSIMALSMFVRRFGRSAAIALGLTSFCSMPLALSGVMLLPWSVSELLMTRSTTMESALEGDLINGALAIATTLGILVAVRLWSGQRQEGDASTRRHPDVPPMTGA